MERSAGHLLLSTMGGERLSPAREALLKVLAFVLTGVAGPTSDHTTTSNVQLHLATLTAPPTRDPAPQRPLYSSKSNPQWPSNRSLVYVLLGGQLVSVWEKTDGLVTDASAQDCARHFHCSWYVSSRAALLPSIELAGYLSLHWRARLTL